MILFVFFAVSAIYGILFGLEVAGIPTLITDDPLHGFQWFVIWSIALTGEFVSAYWFIANHPDFKRWEATAWSFGTQLVFSILIWVIFAYC